MSVLVASTLTNFAMDSEDTWGSWLINADAIAASIDEEVVYFCAIETDARGIEPFAPLIDAMRAIDTPAFQWSYHLDDGRDTVTTANRLRHLTLGQLICSGYATDSGASHMLFLAADLEPPADCLPKLLEVGHPLVGGHVSTYCQGNGDPTLAEYPASWDVREQAMTAAFVLIDRSLFKTVKWRSDPDLGMTDDPAFTYDAEQFHGVRTLVRRDVEGRHHPEAIPPIEARGYDLTVVR